MTGTTNHLDELEQIPGTTYVVDTVAGHAVHVSAEKPDGAKRHGKIVLHPQPSNDPNDPLNWSRIRKELQFVIVFFWALIQAATLNWYGPVYAVMNEHMSVSMGTMNIAPGLSFLFLGLGCVVLQPIALKYGRRIVYIIGVLLAILGNCLLGGITSYGSFVASNILTGLAASPVDVLVPTTVIDTFFLHEHGTRLSIYLFALYGGSYLGPVAAGYIYEGQGSWEWCVWWQVIICGGLLIVVLLALDDSIYKRDEHTPSSSETSESVSKKSYWQNRRLIDAKHGVKKSYLALVWAPFTTLRYPAVSVASIVYGTSMIFLKLLSLTQAQFFEAEPYNFSEDAAGLVNVSTFIGAFFGMVYGSWSDWFQLWMTKRNKGIFEPEFRLWTLGFAIVIYSAGILMYGLGVKNGVQWVMPVFGVAFMGFGISACGAIGLTYAVDCYPEQMGTLVVVILLIRNLIGMLFTFVFQYWLDGMGITNTTIFLAVICIVFNGSLGMFIIWGKTWRRKTAQWYFQAIEDESR